MVRRRSAKPLFTGSNPVAASINLLWIFMPRLQASIFWAFIFVLTSTLPAFAAKPTVNFGLQAGYLRGNTTYDITLGTGTSELKWPLDMYMAGFKYSLSYKDFGFSVSYLKAPSRRYGTFMEDTDLELNGSSSGSSQASRLIYSETGLKAEGNVANIGAHLFLMHYGHSSCGLRAGYSYYSFTYSGYDTLQVTTGSENSGIFVPGHVIYYKVDYRSWYAGLEYRLELLRRMYLFANLDYSPKVRVKDKDDHLLRYKLSRGNCTGEGVSISLSAMYMLAHGWCAYVDGIYGRIRTDGVQDQVWYGDDPGTAFNETGYAIIGIDQDIDLDLRYIGIGLVYTFQVE